MKRCWHCGHRYAPAVGWEAADVCGDCVAESIRNSLDVSWGAVAQALPALGARKPPQRITTAAGTSEERRQA